LYELIFDLALAAFLVWLGHHRRIRPWGLFALYVAGYSAYRIFEESIRIDSSEHFLGLRLNFYVATLVTLAGIAWFIRAQRAPAATADAAGDSRGTPGSPAGAALAEPGGATATASAREDEAASPGPASSDEVDASTGPES